MYFGYAQLSRYTFVGIGFWLVLAVGFAFTLVYVVGSTKGKRAAHMWTDACLLTVVVGGILDIVWAVASGEWRSFMRTIGVLPLVEMALLGLLFIGTMWFMAVRYTQGLDK